MIIGIGTDIVEIERIKKAVEKWGGRFLNKIYTEKEISYCYLRKDPFAHLAGRFAAKEAVIKAFSGVEKQLLDKETPNKIRKNQMPYAVTFFSSTIKTPVFKEIEICNDDYGSPHITLYTPYFNTKQMNAFIHLSISHEKSYAVATVIIELREY